MGFSVRPFESFRGRRRGSLPPAGHEVRSPMCIKPKQAQLYGVKMIMMDRTVDLLVTVRRQ